MKKQFSVASCQLPVFKAQESGIRNQELEIFRRMCWRCRRGLLELDILLGRFVEAHYAGLSDAERQTFEELLDMPDNHLWDMISGKHDATSGEQKVLLGKIRAV